MESIPIGISADLSGFIAIIICLCIVAFLSSSEAALISVNKLRIKHLAEKGNKSAKTVQNILKKHERLFGTILLTENFFIIAATSLGTAILLNIFGKEGWIYASMLMTILIVLLGEVTPKTIAVTYSFRIALIVSHPIKLLISITHPIVWLFTRLPGWLLKIFGAHTPPSPFVTEEDIKAMIDMGEEEGSLHEDERDMLHKVFEFGDTVASEAMVPRTEIVAIDESAPVRNALALVKEKGYSRYPVIRESVDNILGILYVKDIIINMAEGKITEDTSINESIREAYYIPENKKIRELLDEMQKNKFQITIVVDEYGGTAGLITLEDLMEEIVGSLQDEFEELETEKDVEIIDERTFIVSGTTELDEIEELISVSLISDDFNTIGGFIFGLFGRLPRIGEQIRYHNLRFLILDMEERKISKIKVTKL
ncbi:magnesium and cobalt efflux protein CorC [bacterium BMS3Abin07]|nr:magnesium and cobalt efflux protein CorC [bacterium BMS3Abin07]HDL20535.1 HlyC/CorC family transporter [Nitrospirota bacterium]HDO22565.1 HlyC/CorC family transporter [Nitrospirota bacterium]HDZ87564.1 HlyC/CorC family transporter [Nitrospirota bacterium]